MFTSGGDLYTGDDLKFDEVNARNANISGISTVGTTLLDVNGNLDVDGRTEVDITNISPSQCCRCFYFCWIINLPK